MMNVNEIEELLNLYYQGETDEDQEEKLMRFFTEEDVPEHLLAEKEYFLHLAVQPVCDVPDGLEERLSNAIDAWDTSERRMLKVERSKRVIRLQWLGSIAASLIILFSVGVYVYKSNAPAVPQDTCATPQEAYAQAQKALVMLSSRLNKGIEEMKTVNHTTDKIKASIHQQLNRINNKKQ